jgi:hypothetical protein
VRVAHVSQRRNALHAVNHRFSAVATDTDARKAESFFDKIVATNLGDVRRDYFTLILISDMKAGDFKHRNLSSLNLHGCFPFFGSPFNPKLNTPATRAVRLMALACRIASITEAIHGAISYTKKVLWRSRAGGA